MVFLGVGKRNEYRCGEYQGGGMKGVFTIKYDWWLLSWRLEKSLYSTSTRNDSCRRVGLDPQHDHFMLGLPTRWYLKTRASAWNIVCAGYSRWGFALFM